MTLAEEMTHQAGCLDHQTEPATADLLYRGADEIERLKAELAKAREREEIMCMALTNQIEFEWSDDYVVGPGYGRMVVEYPYGTEVRTFEGRWDDCLNDAAREEQ